MNKWDDLYMDIAVRVAKQSHGIRAQVGAVIVKDNNILSFGYNGTPAGMDNKCEIEHFDTIPGFNGARIRLETKKEVLHAETNAIAKIAKSTQSSDGATIYTSLAPCFECSKLIIQSGITRLVYGEKYRDDSSITFLEQNNIKVEQHERTIPLGREVSTAIDPTMYSPGEPEDDLYYPQKQG
jgi:dCMP deaminase